MTETGESKPSMVFNNLSVTSSFISLLCCFASWSVVGHVWLGISLTFLSIGAVLGLIHEVRKRRERRAITAAFRSGRR